MIKAVDEREEVSLEKLFLVQFNTSIRTEWYYSASRWGVYIQMETLSEGTRLKMEKYYVLSG